MNRNKKLAGAAFVILISIIIGYLLYDNRRMRNISSNLAKENAALQSQLTKCSADLEVIRTSDKYLYSSAMDFVAKGDIASLTQAISLLKSLIQKYPSSPLRANAENQLASLSRSVAILDRVNAVIQCINNNKCDEALSRLQHLKGEITEDAYQRYYKKIEYQRNRPEEVDLADLIASPASYVGKRIHLTGPFRILNNDLPNGTFAVAPDKYIGYDSDKEFDIIYKRMSTASSLHRYESGAKIDYAIGIWRVYIDNIDKGYLDAEEIP